MNYCRNSRPPFDRMHLCRRQTLAPLASAHDYLVVMRLTDLLMCKRADCCRYAYCHIPATQHSALLPYARRKLQQAVYPFASAAALQ